VNDVHLKRIEEPKITLALSRYVRNKIDGFTCWYVDTSHIDGSMWHIRANWLNLSIMANSERKWLNT